LTVGLLALLKLFNGCSFFSERSKNNEFNFAAINLLLAYPPTDCFALCACPFNAAYRFNTRLFVFRLLIARLFIRRPHARSTLLYPFIACLPVQYLLIHPSLAIRSSLTYSFNDRLSF